jgi:ubiquinone biosynthesis protein
MKSGKLKIEFQHMGLEEIEESIEKSANRLSVSIIIAAILIGSALLLLAKTPPMLFGIPVLGLAGFVTAVGMGIVLIRSIYKKGRL